MMSGFKDDIISILRSYSMIQLDSAGLVLAPPVYSDAVIKEVTRLGGLCVSSFPKKPVIRFDYVVISESIVVSKGFACLPSLLEAFSLLNVGGIIIIDVTITQSLFKNNYTSLFGGFSITKVKYGTSQYLVIHNGIDYGN